MPIPVIIIAKSNEGTTAGKLNCLDAEMDGIDMELRPLKLAKKVEVVKLSAASFKSIIQTFQDYRGRVVAFHYSGHANGHQLLLKNKEGIDNQLTGSESLPGFLGTQEKLELVFLNGCSTQGQADLYKEAGVKNIITTSKAIRDDVAYELGRAFYQSLATGASINNAFDEARAQTKGQTGKHNLRDLLFEEDPTSEEDVWQLTGSGKWTPFANVGSAKYTDHLMGGLSKGMLSIQEPWERSLYQKLQSKVSVQNNALSIFQHYGWLIEVFLLKIKTTAEEDDLSYRLSFMVAAYKSSLRYLCYIQLAQVMQLTQQKAYKKALEDYPKKSILIDFFQTGSEHFANFDFLNLLTAATEFLEKHQPFMPQLTGLAEELHDTDSELYQSVIFLESYASKLESNRVPQNDNSVLDEYLTALTFWLREISFIAEYRLVSIMDISIQYSFGTAKNFVHHFGELHSIYGKSQMPIGMEEGDSSTKKIEDVFTYSQSILLFKGNNIDVGLNDIDKEGAYLSLSPLLIDQSVFQEQTKQTPEIYGYAGRDKRKFVFGKYKNELAYSGKIAPASNKCMDIKSQNMDMPKLDELFEQLQLLFKPFKGISS